MIYIRNLHFQIRVNTFVTPLWIQVLFFIILLLRLESQKEDRFIRTVRYCVAADNGMGLATLI